MQVRRPVKLDLIVTALLEAVVKVYVLVLVEVSKSHLLLCVVKVEELFNFTSLNACFANVVKHHHVAGFIVACTMLAKSVLDYLSWCDARAFNFSFDQFVPEVLAKLEITALREDLGLRATCEEELQRDFEALDMAKIFA